MLTKSELLLCSAGAIALVAYSVSHQIDPAIATKELVDATLQATLYGLKSTLHFAYQTGKAGAIVFGSYVALKAVAAVAKRVNQKVQARIADPEGTDEEEDEEELSFQDETLSSESEAEAEAAFTIMSWNEDDYDEDEDEDYSVEMKNLRKLIAEDALIDQEELVMRNKKGKALTVPLTDKEVKLLLKDQTRVAFYHRAVICHSLSPIENTTLKGPYRLRPR